MLENRPIVTIAIGYIIGILGGLYCNTSIAFLYLILFLIYKLLKVPKTKKFKLISFRRYFRYIKIIITKKVFIVIILMSIISNTVILYQNSVYDKIQNNLEDKEIQIQATIISNVESKSYKNIYKIKIEKILKSAEKEISKYLIGKSMYLNLNKKIKYNNIEYGDTIKIKAIYKKPQTRKNYKAFDYKEYLQTIGIYGTIEAKEIEKDTGKRLDLRTIYN